MRNWIWSEKIHYNCWAECLFIENRKVFWQKLSSLCCTNWGLLSFATESENIDNRAAFWYFSHENSSLLLWHHLGDFTFSECKSIKIWATPCVLDFSAGLNFKFRKFDKLSETSPPSGWYTLQANLVHIFIDVTCLLLKFRWSLVLKELDLFCNMSVSVLWTDYMTNYVF